MRSKFLIPYLFVIVILFVSCDSKEVKEEKEKTTEEPLDTIAPMVETTAIDILATEKFPSPFYQDSVFINDSISYVDHSGKLVSVAFGLNGYFPQSGDPSHKKFNIAIRKKAEDYLMDFKKGDNFTTTYITAEISAISLEYDSVVQVVSAGFMYQSFSEGAAHYNHGYISFNYDLKENKEILLTDLLLFKNEDEKQKFCDAFNPFPYPVSGQVYLESHDFSATQDFEIIYDGIKLYFDDYEKGPSMTYIHIPHHKFRGYVNKKYSKLFSQE